ncbi:MAG: DUF2782 domain-containing protein [Gammaproteobacteria bacterium]|nr:DUF2782 domain-containing protein [Gammaproteobacteria bacterium]MYF28751.1 DUF2782 domain-containing protein [Gammaproteobacteria bacterium]MYK45756.1 DUF2782 domain-containing protein [Gammaproteobacteria bacterium]MYK47698.1 DUF2782 domain-containing protein [Gammaproteobacteria bacterium]
MFAVLAATGGAAEEQGGTPAASTPPSEEARERPAPNGTGTAPADKEAPGVRPTRPPPAPSLEEARGPDVTLIAGEERTVYEYRQNGKLRMIKVVPKVGKPYYLAPRDPTTGFGDLEEADTLVPRWVLIEF